MATKEPRWTSSPGSSGSHWVPSGRTTMTSVFGMAFPIDVLYVNKRWRIVAVSENLRPGRIDRPVPHAWFVVEMAAGAIRQTGIKVGDRLETQG